MRFHEKKSHIIIKKDETPKKESYFMIKILKYRINKKYYK